jgi:hypothetical protein
MFLIGLIKYKKFVLRIRDSYLHFKNAFRFTCFKDICQPYENVYFKNEVIIIF